MNLHAVAYSNIFVQTRVSDSGPCLDALHTSEHRSCNLIKINDSQGINVNMHNSVNEHGYQGTPRTKDAAHY